MTDDQEKRFGDWANDAPTVTPPPKDKRVWLLPRTPDALLRRMGSVARIRELAKRPEATAMPDSLRRELIRRGWIDA